MATFLTIHENLRTAMHFFGEATGAGAITQLPGALAIYCGLDYGVFNIAILENIAGERTAIAQMQDRLDQLTQHFRVRRARWSLWLCEDMLAPAHRRQARQLLANAGMRIISNPPGMSCTQLHPRAGTLPAIDLRPVSDISTRTAFTEMTALCFEIPFDIAQSVYGPQRAWEGAYQGFVGYSEGKPVAICALVETKDALGIYSLATHPSYRRLGYGEAVMRTAIQIQQRNGTPLVLQSTEAGYALYRRMGFKECARFSVYLTK